MSILPRSEELVRAMAEESPAMLWMGDQNGGCVFLNAALRRFWGVNPERLEDFDWFSTVHPDDIGTLAGPFEQAMAAHTPFMVAARYRRADGVYRTMRTEANPRFAEDGRFLGMTGVNVDITDQLLAEEHGRFLMGELNHRTKNLLAGVQALARQTLHDSTAKPRLDQFDRRLHGLAASNDLLLRNDWSGVLFADLAAVQLGYFAELVGTRVTASGPALRIPPRGAQTLGMALHELTTNSLKYGALAEPAGHVDLRWTTEPNGGWTIEWREDNPRPVVAPQRRGFGSRVLVDMVESSFDADVTVEYGPSGLVWRAVAPAG
jgi:PAS domain S-box-containing protein